MAKQQFMNAAEYINQSPDPFGLIMFLMRCPDDVFLNFMEAITRGQEPTAPEDHQRAHVRAWQDRIDAGLADDNDMLKGILPPSMFAGPDHPYWAH